MFQIFLKVSSSRIYHSKDNQSSVLQSLFRSSHALLYTSLGLDVPDVFNYDNKWRKIIEEKAKDLF